MVNFTGQIVYIHSYDVAYDMRRNGITTLLGYPVSAFSIGPSKRIPKRAFFYSPKMVSLGPVEHQSSAGRVSLDRTLKIFDVGAISIQYKLSFDVPTLSELVYYHDLILDGQTVHEHMRELAEQARKELEPYLIRPIADLGPGEDYTIFCINQIPSDQPTERFRAEKWLKRNRRVVAGILTQEEDAEHLSDQEALESTDRYSTYYENDLVVIDWDAAFILGETEDIDNLLHILELANVQLVELGAYDRFLDESLDKAYRHLTQRTIAISRDVRRSLREINVDLARLSDELVNITKFFGDWHLARIYQHLYNRFHLADWYKTVEQKLQTLGDLYQIIQQDKINFWMVVLETTIVLLFILDVILLLVGL